MAPTKVKTLDDLHDELRRWGRRRDPELVRRRTEAVDPSAQLMVVGEANARTNVRFSGVSWFTRDAELGMTGRRLEEILLLVGYSVHPPKPVEMEDGCAVPARPRGTRTAYTTDLYPAYPLPDGRLSVRNVEAARQSGLLAREIELVRPKQGLRPSSVAPRSP